MTDTVRKVFYLLRQESRVKWAAIVLVAIGVTGVEALGALLVFLLLGLIAAPDTPLELPLFGELRDLPVFAGRDDVAVWVAGAVVVFFLFRSVLVLGQLYLHDRLAHNAGARLAVRVLTAYLAMPYALHVRRNSSELIRNAYESVRSITNEIIIPSVRLISHTVLAFGMIAVLFYAAPLATLAAIAFLGPVVFVLLRVIHPRLKKLGRGRQRLSTANLSLLQQSLHGIREVILFDRAEFFQKLFTKRQNATARITYLNRVAQEIPPLLIETVLVVFIAGFFIVSVTLQRSPESTLAVLGLFAYAALRLQPSLQKIVQSLNSIRFAGAAVDNVYDDLVAVERVAANEAPGEQAFTPGTDATPAEIRLEGISFHYEPDSPPVLRSLDLTIPPGDSIGIVGPTGGGKSTLLDVITGLLAPSEGRVLIDGRDLRTCTKAWQRCLGVVPQTIFLIDDTVRRNIALGIPDDEIEEERIARAVDLAQLSSFLADLPDGLETMVGERGVRMSGGQRQRVAIARAVYREPPVLIFDEGTSALDNLTEAEFMAALDRLGGDRTLITVAHRLTTVRRCDRIAIVEAGRIIDIGTYRELLARNPGFRASVEHLDKQGHSDAGAPAVHFGEPRS
jgi:ATP-binding cassette, subfamily B, bacterial PglK